ncbi:Gfo/Idh/MocA family oxidoreductase [Propionibacterium freudenreichii]|uniref:Gfo/Idh/MocA family oxidoreductase n=1 Tax=Propionibacterium freudenreichii TaxID=1744 RepID=UPI000BC2F03F|nr:Gfo/Idh/MocA family oxidoreductase [Propionibacterium freudenreichii]MDK9296018.1 Gfo/Idh/MocA family oxidoreductase [Propionibacterium freudenreichii]MDK9361411.1 Gfo/Idh/MocA family oxidoreductase [Propionibacterium freudenreichii]MDK9640359.1 Gfo/Idh/MocA family oxidoreductase [Propionibacterium freudenreichii]WGU89991.1 Gfo/Idh/MocA family oxidoreductase [Propionibacterium freudenreichii]SCQ75983.1 Inositol 2-dehydrogenase IdhA [Propionibacterium freudenreichii]
MTLRIGLVGAGFIGSLHARNLFASPRFDLAVVAEPNADHARAVEELTGATIVPDWRTLVDDDSLDAVLIASPAEDHPEQVGAFARAGKHVYCEKPLGLTLEAADAAVAAVQEAGTLLQMGFNRRLDPNMAALHANVADGRVGDPLIVNIISRDPGLPDASYQRGPGKMFMDTSIHDFDTARFLAGSEIVEVSAFSAALVDELARDAGDADTCLITLRFANGALGVIDNSRLATYGYDQRAEVLGTLGLASMGNVPSTTTTVADGAGYLTPPLPDFFPERYVESYRIGLDVFADAIEKGSPVASDGHDARQALAAAFAAEQSRREQRAIPLNQ